MELKDRMEVEDRFRGVLLTVMLRHKAELIRLMGNPPDLSNVPMEFWERVEEDNRDELLKWLVLIFWHAATQHGMDATAARNMAVNFSINRTLSVLEGMSRRTREFILKQVDDWRTKLAQGNRISNDDIAERLDIVFGETRSELIAASETTEAAVYGGSVGVSSVYGLSDSDIWFTQEDERVCPYCGPLHLAKRRDWARIYYEQILPVHPEFSAYGPPGDHLPHPRCRCWRVYVSENQ